jgi:hypothetical protein
LNNYFKGQFNAVHTSMQTSQIAYIGGFGAWTNWAGAVYIDDLTVDNASEPTVPSSMYTVTTLNHNQ